MTPINVTNDEMRDARAAGFRKKKPRKPKSKTESSLLGYIERYNRWAKDLKEAAKEGKRLRDLKTKVTRL